EPVANHRIDSIAAHLPPLSARAVPRGSRSPANDSCALDSHSCKAHRAYLKGGASGNSASNRKTNHCWLSVLNQCANFLVQKLSSFTNVDSDPKGTITQPSPEARLIIFTRWETLESNVQNSPVFAASLPEIEIGFCPALSCCVISRFNLGFAKSSLSVKILSSTPICCISA